ncbi:PilZ domain-containing protein [Corallococcus sp. BB11-1]|uniref:PilZ domain-containing protein n=1 Tax=Corallococcus sp. BB11-1 TaxID=2996783 RepID=UPI00226ED85E|nr:PilZ domain-containing protein [Corallococcus sp. BB11-1]MCY1029857.1 PilZ domain-containing protein [Corallococcus sp. BB11-1]
MGAQFARAQPRPSSEAPELEWDVGAPPVIVREDVTDPERIRAILTTAVALGSRALLRRGDRASPLRLERLERDTGRLHWRCVAPDAGPCHVELQGHGCVYRLHVAEGPHAAGAWVTSLPSRIVQVRRRAHRRAPSPRHLCVRLPLPGWLGRERGAVDLSLGGLSLRLAPGERLSVGRSLEPIELLTEDGARLSLRGEVRHVTACADGALHCGLQVTPGSRDDAERWRALVEQALHPTTRADGALVEAHWRLFSDSGYFDLAGRSPEWFEARRASFVALGQRARGLEAVLSEVVWPSERGVEATLSVMKPYRSVWMVHQLARHPDASRYERARGQMLRDLYVRAVEHAQADSGFRWLASYIESTVPFTHRVHVGFAERMAHTGRTCLLPMRMIDVECAPPQGRQDSELELGPATEAERRRLAEELALTRPPCYAEALDLRLEALDLADAARSWRARGLERERHLLVARAGTTPLAVAVLEVGPPGTNPFRLLDSARLFPLSARGRDAYPALLDEARRWFASRGRDGFTFLAEAPGDVEAAGLHDEAPEMKPYLWLIPADLAPEFLEHLHEQTACRPLPIPDKELS